METVTIFNLERPSPRMELGMEYIRKALRGAGYPVRTAPLPDDPTRYRQGAGPKIYIGCRKDAPFLSWLEREELLLYHGPEPQPEGFYLETCPARLTVIAGGDDTGALYGCLELAGRIADGGGIPRNLACFDAPVFQLRGPCLGLQKTRIEPPRLTYEYPITPGRFPWFYDRSMWTKFLDRMLKMRCNVLYIWSGHPFSSLVKVAGYPEALEVTEEEYRLNRETFGWLATECDRRGIWLVLQFYNIHIPLSFARKHGLEQRQTRIHPLVADYTRKSIVEFIRSFPHIGLMVCLGEALRGTQNKTDWFVRTIVPAVKEGARKAGLTEEPPVILRGHDCDPVAAIRGAQKIYSNLCTMWKYNGESLTTCFPRGEWQKQHRSMSSLGTTHIVNVHVLADLEPFRYQAPLFIMRCVQAAQNRLGGNGLHLYPLFYWDWPYSPDKTEPRLLQMDRDWLWYEAWFRYAWNPGRDEKTEKIYWTHRLAVHFGCEETCAARLLDAMESAGQCAPKILGRVGITEGNRQTFSLGMTMSQLTNAGRYRPNPELWHSVARRGEQPDEFVQKERRGQPHIGETPLDTIEEVSADASCARENFRLARESMKPSDELAGIGHDIEAIGHLTDFYCDRIRGALRILTYQNTMDENLKGDISLLEEARVWMGKSLRAYRKLSDLTSETYLYANSMQTPQRKIPFPDGGRFRHWVQCLPEYRREAENFSAHLDDMKRGVFPSVPSAAGSEARTLPQADFILLSDDCERYEIQKHASLFTDRSVPIQETIPEIRGLTGIRFSSEEAVNRGVGVELELKEDSRILIAYMKARDIHWLQVPELETDTHADDRGGLAPVFQNAMAANGCPPIDIHAFRYEKGRHELYFGTGAYAVVGVIPQKVKLVAKNAEGVGKSLETLDWLYE